MMPAGGEPGSFPAPPLAGIFSCIRLRGTQFLERPDLVKASPAVSPVPASGAGLTAYRA